MKSHLTRSVFRALIANRPYSARDCLRVARRKQYGLPYRYDRVQSAQISAISFSGLFGFGSKQTARRHATDPGLEEMKELAEAKAKNYEPPQRALILDAFRVFFQSRCKRPRTINASQLAVATEALEFLQEKYQYGTKTDKENKVALGAIDYSRALTAIASIPSRKIDKSAEPFATLLFEALLQYADRQDRPADFEAIYSSAVRCYVEILTRTGFTSRARDMLKTVYTERTTWTPQHWNSVLHGLLFEGRQSEALETLKHMDSMGLDLDAYVYAVESVNTSFLASGSLELSRALYAFATSKSITLTSQTLQAMIMLCLKQGNTEFGDQIIKDMKDDSHSTETRVVETLWSTRGRTPHDILSDISEQCTNGALTPDQEKQILDALIKLYAAEGDLKSLDECLTYWDAHELGFSSQFLLYRIERWVDTSDVAQAYNGYHRLLSEEVGPELKDKVTSLLSRLLVATCLSKDTRHDQVMELLDALSKQNATLEPKAVAAVCRRLLLQDELSELSDFLNARIDAYSTPERNLIQQEFLDFCMDKTIDDTRAWEIYDLFREIFPESSVETRTKIMRSFFSRKRSDLASLVFGHMRQSEILERRPTSDTYAECFAGIAKDGDKAALNLVHNMLKLDMEVTPNLKITNSLMAAYAGCGMAYQSLEYLEELLNSRTGPNESSFALALRACETYFGDGLGQAQMIMENLKKSDVDLTREIWVAYIGALAANDPNTGANAVHSMEDTIGEKPDAFVIATMYNAVPWDYQKEQVQKWANREWPALWKELSDFPREEDEWGNQNFCIDRSISP